MQTHLQVEWVSLPAEREGEWRHAIELIAEIMKGYFMNMQIDEMNQYRFAWLRPGEAETHYGSFLFSSPAEAKSTKNTMQMMFRDYVIWLEDREHNRIPIPN